MKPYSEQNRQALMNAPANKAEGWALVELARRLDRASKNPEDKNAIKDITRLNWRIWTIIQSAMLDPANEIPISLRSNLVNLSNFIDKRSVEILANPDVKKLDVLININRQIGAGLLGNPSDDPDDLELVRQKAIQDGLLDEKKINPESLIISAEKKKELSVESSVESSAVDYGKPLDVYQAPKPGVSRTIPNNMSKADTNINHGDIKHKNISAHASVMAALENSPKITEDEQQKLANYAEDLEAKKKAMRAETLKKILSNRSVNKV